MKKSILFFVFINRLFYTFYLLLRLFYYSFSSISIEQKFIEKWYLNVPNETTHLKSLQNCKDFFFIIYSYN